MTEAIRLYWGRFGHVSVLTVANDFVTHAHVEAVSYTHLTLPTIYSV